MNFLEDYYSGCDEEGRLLSRHGQVEYLTTMRYIKEWTMRRLTNRRLTRDFSRELAADIDTIVRLFFPFPFGCGTIIA
jgi:hypothetical protein